MMTVADKIESYEKMLKAAHTALESLSAGTASAVTIENRNFTNESRSDLLSYIGQLEAKLFALRNPNKSPFRQFRFVRT